MDLRMATGDTEGGNQNLETIRATVNEGSDGGGIVLYIGLREHRANSRQTGFTEPEKQISTAQQCKFSYWDVIGEGIPALPPSATNNEQTKQQGM
jgi:hypothetical protein